MGAKEGRDGVRELTGDAQNECSCLLPTLVAIILVGANETRD